LKFQIKGGGESNATLETIMKQTIWKLMLAPSVVVACKHGCNGTRMCHSDYTQVVNCYSSVTEAVAIP